MHMYVEESGTISLVIFYSSRRATGWLIAIASEFAHAPRVSVCLPRISGGLIVPDPLKLAHMHKYGHGNGVCT